MKANDSHVFFELKQKFLQDIPHPKIIGKGVVQANIKATKQVPIELQQMRQHIPELPGKLSNYLYEKINSALSIKHQIAQAINYHELALALKKMYDYQIDLVEVLNAFVPTEHEVNSDEIKMSDPIDPYALLKIIKERNLIDDEIKDYLCIEINKGIVDDFTLLFLRANKIAKHA